MKSSTDLYWNDRAKRECDHTKVNIADTVQRDHELQFVFDNLHPTMRIVEVGCGNGYVTQQLRQRVAHVDAFDYAENMIERARQAYGESNNRFFCDSVLDPKHVSAEYDAAICIRVLINLRDLDEQKHAVRNIARMMRSGARLILIEGFRDGFDAINDMRNRVGLSKAHPAPINYYSHISDLMPDILVNFEIERTWHSGMFDFLTRVVYPLLVGADKAIEPSDFHLKIEPLIRANTHPDLRRYARLIGFSLAKK